MDGYMPATSDVVRVLNWRTHEPVAACHECGSPRLRAAGMQGEHAFAQCADCGRFNMGIDTLTGNRTEVIDRPAPPGFQAVRFIHAAGVCHAYRKQTKET